jgi:hypothetical protein
MEHSEIVSEIVQAHHEVTTYLKKTLANKARAAGLPPHVMKRLDEYIQVLSRAEKHLDMIRRAGVCRNVPALERMFRDMGTAAQRLTSSCHN